jgi:hypothetical protein
MLERSLMAAFQGALQIAFVVLVIGVPVVLISKALRNNASSLFRKALVEGKSAKCYAKGPFSHKPYLMVSGIETVLLESPSSVFTNEEIDAIRAVAPELVDMYLPFVGMSHMELIRTINENAERKKIDDEAAKAERELAAMGQKVERRAPRDT